jgi:hypothetical protein
MAGMKSIREALNVTQEAALMTTESEGLQQPPR